MGAVNTTYTFTATDTITSAKMNNIIDETVMTGDAVLGGSGGSGGLDIASGKLSISANAINNSRLAAGSVSNTNVSDTAAIAGTKISPNFGTQNIVTTGSIDVGVSSLGSTFLKRTDTTNEGGDLAFAKAIDNTVGFTIDCFGNTSSPDLRFIAGPSVAAILTTNGNVGIGTTVPNYKLHVYDGNAAIINTTANAAVYVGESTGVNEYGYLLWDRTDNTFKLGTQNNPIVFGTSSNDWMRLTTSGNLGIGTTTPLCKLAVTGTSGAYNGSGTEGIFQITTGTGANTDDKLQFGVVDSNYSWIQASDPGTSVKSLILNGAGGNIGIGKTNPSTALDVNGTVTATAFAGPLTGNADTVTNGVYTTGTQTIGGAKTFSSAIFLADGGFMFASDGAQDTGMSWNSDGVMNVVCNGQVPGQFTTSGWTGNAATATTVSNSAITAAKLDGNQSGSAPIFGARAWVNFNGTGTIAIRDSGNVSSITDNDTGNYSVNFATAMQDANFSTVVTSGRENGNQDMCQTIVQPVSGAGVQVLLSQTNTSTSRQDSNVVCVAVFR